jgi:general secretion pathway protein G
VNTPFLNRQRKFTGFTLVEMVVVVAIVGILASAAIPFVRYGEHRLKERELRHALREIRSAIDAYQKATLEGRIPRKVDSTGYPPDLTTLTEGVADAKTPDARKIYFLRRIPRDPFAPPETPDNDMWGLRCYASSASEPKAGDDVFDIYSLNPGTGSNGAPYRDW